MVRAVPRATPGPVGYRSARGVAACARVSAQPQVRGSGCDGVVEIPMQGVVQVHENGSVRWAGPAEAAVRFVANAASARVRRRIRCVASALYFVAPQGESDGEDPEVGGEPEAPTRIDSKTLPGSPEAMGCLPRRSSSHERRLVRRPRHHPHTARRNRQRCLLSVQRLRRIVGNQTRHQTTRSYTPRHNGKAECYQRILADELLYAREFSSEAARSDAIAVWNIHYNYHRPHTGAGGAPPASRVDGDSHRVSSLLIAAPVGGVVCPAVGSVRKKICTEGGIHSNASAAAWVRWPAVRGTTSCSGSLFSEFRAVETELQLPTEPPLAICRTGPHAGVGIAPQCRE